MIIKHVLFVFIFANFAFGELILWYNKPAAKFEEAIPIGNGRLGGMVYGEIAKDRISLNESTVWNGDPGNNNKGNAANYLADARNKIFANDAAGACAAARNMIGGWESSYQPVGNFYLEFTGQTATNYRRELDLKTAISKTQYSYNGVTYTREYFASYPDQTIVIRLTADQPGKVSYAVSMDCPHGNKNITTSGSDILLLNATINAIKFQARVKVKTDGGTVTASNGKINISGANSSTILIAIGTNFNSYNDVSGNQEARAQKYITDADLKTYDQIKADHLKSYKELFDRVDIDLGKGTADSTFTTGEQVKKFATSNDPQLVRLYYQFGRYLMISSSRGESQPANLQGVWNESTNPSWGSKYTININTEMNYWMTESANLPECAGPLFKKIKSMVSPGQQTAKAHWGSDKGWVAHHNTDLWNRTAPIDGPWGVWPSGGGWLSTHLWEHYLFTQDKAFLADIYSALKGSAEFFLATMVEEPFSGNKYLGTCPSASPESKPSAWNCEVSFAPTMDIQIIRDVLNYTIEASKILNVDSDLRSQAETAVKRLPPSKVGSNKQLQEWFKDWGNPTELYHRHVSHLYGLFPSAQITVRGTPDLAEGAKATLIQRGDDATGWSLAWKINLWARLEDGNHAYTLIQLLLRPERTDINLFDEHPPFQIDGNFGAVSGINEMLLQSQNGEINFLPALPDIWSNGSFRGLRARGGFVVDTVKWSSKTLNRVVISSVAGSTCNVRYKTITKSFETKAGVTYVLDGSLNIIDQYNADGTAVKGSPAYQPESKTGRTTKLPDVKVTVNAGKISVQLTENMTDASICIFNLSGKLIFATTKKIDKNTSILIPKMKSGLYMVSVNNKELKYLEKVLVR